MEIMECNAADAHLTKLVFNWLIRLCGCCIRSLTAPANLAHGAISATKDAMPRMQSLVHNFGDMLVGGGQQVCIGQLAHGCSFL